MYEPSEHRQDMLDMLVDDSNYKESKLFKSYVRNGQLLVRVEMDPVVIGGSLYTSPAFAMQM